jgi:hypothetical protein
LLGCLCTYGALSISEIKKQQGTENQQPLFHAGKLNCKFTKKKGIVKYNAFVNTFFINIIPPPIPFSSALSSFRLRSGSLYASG